VGPVGLPGQLVMDYRVGRGERVCDHCQPRGPIQWFAHTAGLNAEGVEVYKVV